MLSREWDYYAQITSIDSPIQVHVSTTGGSNCGTVHTLNFSFPNIGSYLANNIVKNGGSNNLPGEFGNVGTNTRTNNNVVNAYGGTWGLKTSTQINAVDGDPGLVRFTDNDWSNSDLHLSVGSPDIAAGTATNAPAFDFDGNPVPLGTAVDVGAYAYNPHPHATIEKFWNWLATGFSTAFHKTVYAASTATTQSTNGYGGQTGSSISTNSRPSNRPEASAGISHLRSRVCRGGQTGTFRARRCVARKGTSRRARVPAVRYLDNPTPRQPGSFLDAVPGSLLRAD